MTAIVDRRPVVEIEILDTSPPPPPAPLPRPRHGTGLVIASLLIVVVLVAWGLGHWGSTTAPMRDDLLVVDEDGNVALLDPGTGESVYEVPRAVVSPDRSALFTTSAAVGGGTRLESRNPESGALTGSTLLSGKLAIRAVSPAGGAIALMAPRGAELGLYEPESRTTTDLTVAFSDERPALDFSLTGNFEPEAFSVDESTLYLLEFLPPEDPDFYLVREMDIASGDIELVKSPQIDIQPEMRGVARAQAIHPDGDTLFTLYSIPSGADPVHDVTASGESERWAFIHVLDLQEGTDFCIFLPAPMGEINEATIGLGLSPDGEILYVVDPSTALVARIDTTRLEITDMYEVPEISSPDLAADVAVADDGTLYVALGDRIHEFSAQSLDRVQAWDTGALTTGLSVSTDGSQLRFAREGRIHLLDRETRSEVAVIDGPGGGDVTILGPPSGKVVQIPLECAC